MNHSIFYTYTGSAFLNNALQTIESLATLEDVTKITPQVLSGLYKKYEVWNLFKRMKSYSMLFTRNGPLLNNKEYGEKIYKGIIDYILHNFEKEGMHICEVSGLKYQISFEEIYEHVLKDIEYPEKKIASKDKSINRCWFPLIGALGSDAQALPQAKFGVNIHPICLVIIQFLPFSALIYKGGILLFDSVNFEFSKDFIEESTDRVLKEISLTEEDKSVNNIKDYNKGTYLLKAIELFSAKEDDYEDTYSDLNLWSFSNSGTGASCEIDRVPNQLFQKLLILYKVESRDDLVMLLSSKISNLFLEALAANEDFWGLNPTKKQTGVGVPFYENYQKLINNERLLNYASYIAYLLKNDTQLKKSEVKLLEKTDAYTFPEYRSLLFTVLIRASENKKWSLNHHLEILDNPNELPVNSSTFCIFKMIHFYYQKPEKHLLSIIPKVAASFNCQAAKACSLVIELINDYANRKSTYVQKRLLDPQENKVYSLRPILVFAARRFTLEQVYELYFKDFKSRRLGLNDLLRMYFSNPVEIPISDKYLELELDKNFNKYRSFAALYLDYYFSKYQNLITKKIPHEKFAKHVLLSFPKFLSQYKNWLNQAKDNVFTLLKEQKNNPFTNPTRVEIEQLFEDILYDEFGELNLSFSRFAIEFSLHKIYSLTH